MNLHDFSLPALGGKSTINFADYKGRKVLLVNTASACGYTPQYAELQELYAGFSEKLVVVGCPCNDFGGQEPETNPQKIADFCQIRYGVTFPLTEKIGIKPPNEHQLFGRIQDILGSAVSWNFQKFLFDEDGRFIRSFAPSESPLNLQLIDLISGQ